MAFGDKVRQRRIELRMTQDQLAEKIDESITRQAVSKWENGPSAYPQIEALLGIAVALDISIDDLFEEELAFLKRREFSTKGQDIEKTFPGAIAGLKVFAELLESIKRGGKTKND